MFLVQSRDACSDEIVVIFSRLWCFNLPNFDIVVTQTIHFDLELFEHRRSRCKPNRVVDIGTGLANL